MENLLTLLGEGDSAYGVNCEYDELLTSIDFHDPNWRDIKKNAEALWLKTRDLRVAVLFALSGLAIEGLEGFAAGVSVIRWLVCDNWEGFWPRLDPDDGNDPIERVNTLAMISPAPDAYDDPVKFVQLFRSQRLVPQGPTYTLRDFLIAEGELEAPDAKVDPALLTAELTAVPMDIIAARTAAVEQIADDINAIVDAFSEKTGGQYAVSFQTLQGELKTLRRLYARFNHQDVAAAAETDAPIDGEPPVAGLTGGAVDMSQVRARNRSEALSLLKKCCDYFRQSEPTSPVPYLIDRALRMADMNFMDLLAEIDPSGIDRGRDILGVKTEQQ